MFGLLIWFWTSVFCIFRSNFFSYFPLFHNSESKGIYVHVSRPTTSHMHTKVSCEYSKGKTATSEKQTPFSTWQLTLRNSSELFWKNIWILKCWMFLLKLIKATIKNFIFTFPECSIDINKIKNNSFWPEQTKTSSGLQKTPTIYRYLTILPCSSAYN